MRGMKVLALCGSLRSQSLCAALLRATAELAPAGVELWIFADHGRLPLFNPDLQPGDHDAVQSLRDAVAAADAVIIASPEYAHGVTGTVKNTLDWLVDLAAFAGKPVAVFNPAPDAHHADDALRETLRTMSADLIPGACVRVPVIGSGVDPAAIASSAIHAAAIRSALAAIVAYVPFGSGAPTTR